MRDAMLYPSFDENEFKQEIQVVLGELDRQQAQPIYYLDRTLMDKLFYKYPSRKSPGGTRETRYCSYTHLTLPTLRTTKMSSSKKSRSLSTSLTDSRPSLFIISTGH